MKQTIILLALLASGWSAAHAAPLLTNSVAANRILMIDASSMSIGAGSATLVIGALRRANGVYFGDYKIKVLPYFWKNEEGRLAIRVSDKSLAAVNSGKVAAITGTATTGGAGGKCRRIEATATPAGPNRGKLKLWFMAGTRKMTFEPAYHFAEAGTTAVLPPGTAPRLVARPPCGMATSLSGAWEAPALHL